MITLEQALKTANYKIAGGEKYLWNSFGPNARFLDFYNEYEKYFSVIFDTETQEIYQANLCDAKNNYRLMNPAYIEAYEQEAISKNQIVHQAYDDVKYILLENDEDFLEKAKSIVNDLPYDERIVINVDMDDELFLWAAKEAHKKDMTFNKYLEHILSQFVKGYNEGYDNEG